jgi:hypothetical protein
MENNRTLYNNKNELSNKDSVKINAHMDFENISEIT